MKDEKDLDLFKNFTGDYQKARQSIQRLSIQVSESFKLGKKISPAINLRKTANIIVCGMGGSALGADLIGSLFADKIRVPLIINRNYELPFFANQNSLIVISSYSGNTEEALSCLNEALKKHFKIFIITSGGRLGRLAKQKKLPAVIFKPVDNPSFQPRLGTGYSLGIFWQLLKKIKALPTDDKQENEFIKALRLADKKYWLSWPLAQKIHNKTPIFVAAEFLSGNAHIIANQLNESAKIFASYYLLPELNHHLLEAVAAPLDLRKKWLFVFLKSNLYNKRNYQRFFLTQKIFKKLKINYLNFPLTGATKIAQAASVLVHGSYLSLFTSRLLKKNPLKIPLVDYLKKELKP